MRWTKGKPGGTKHSWAHRLLMFYYLRDTDGNELGWVRKDSRVDPPIFESVVAGIGPKFPAQPTLAKAKAQLVHWFVLQRLDDT